jgi:hypothetical protein
MGIVATFKFWSLLILFFTSKFRTNKSAFALFALLNKAIADEVSDTTDVASGTKSPPHKIKKIYLVCV